MKVLAMSAPEAENYEPTDRTYVIRLRTFSIFDALMKPLKNSDLYDIHDYRINDGILPWESRPFSLDPNLVERILLDFKERKNEFSTLLVHCYRGKNRGPTFAMALNDAFQLGEDSDKLEEQYPKHRRWIYDKIMSIKEGL
jgi:predicted protein tyrosine phosphatase